MEGRRNIMQSTVPKWRIPLALQTLAFVSAAYWLYAIFLTPILEPSTTLRKTVVSSTAAAALTAFSSRPELNDLFPPDAWERDNPMVLETKYGWLLIKQYETTDGNEETGLASEIKLKPCTMVFFSEEGKQNGKTRPIVMQAPDGARLQFDAGTNLRRGKFGNLIQAALVGDVRVFSPPTSPLQNDGFELTTRDLRIKRNRIWTPYEVAFRFGANHGRGRDLVITLGGKDDIPGAQRLGELRSIEIVHLEHLQLEAPAKAFAAGEPKETRKNNAPVQTPGFLKKPGVSDADSGLNSAARPQAERTMISVVCKGPFLFDFEQRLATLEQEVVVTRLPVAADPDQLRGDRLAIHFSEPAADGAKGKRENRLAGKLGAFQLERLTIIGRPAVLNAPSYGASITGGYLEYHLAENQIIASDEKKVVLKYRQIAFEASEVEYTFGPDGRLGQLWSAAGGVLKGVWGQDKPQPFEIRWGGSLRLRPYEGRHVLSVAGGVSAQMQQYGAAHAGEIHLWLRETPRMALGPTASGMKYDLQPERFVALKEVSFDSPKLKLDTPRLEAWIEDVQPSPASAPEKKNADLLNPRKNAPRQFKLAGRLVRLKLLRSLQKVSLDELSIDGEVVLEETVGAGLQGAPFVARGDSLQLVRVSEPSTELTVYGQPVQIAARGMRLTSSNVHMHRGQNRLWIEGPGSLTLNNLQSKLKSTKSGGLDFSNSITASWQAGLTFNGATIRLQEKVETRGGEQVIYSDFVDVSLNRRIDFSKSGKFEEIEADRLAFGGGVFVDSRTSEKGVATSWSQIQVQDLTLDRAAGTLLASGPGWVKSVQRGGDFLKNDSPVSAPKKNNNSLRFVRIEFNHAIRGKALTPSLSRWQLEFQEQVAAIVGPVSRWVDVLTAETPGPEGVVLYCDVLSVTQAGIGPNKERLLELEARGDRDVQVRGELFNAKAHVIKYAVAKDLLVLEGGPRGDTLVSRSEQANSPRIDSAARRILVWPKSNRIEVDDASYLDLGPIGSAARSKR